MRLPRRLARFNKVVTNRIQGIWAGRVPPWAVVLHRGRRSGRAYRTPVLAFRRGDGLVIALLYGEESDWVRNVVAGGGRVVRRGRTYELRNPRVVDADGALAGLSPLARAYCRLADRQLVAELG